MRDDIVQNFFGNNVKMKEIKIHFFCIDLNGAWVENHLHMLSKNCNMLSNAIGCSDRSKNLHCLGF